MINSLLKDLLSERDKNALLEKQVQNAEDKNALLEKQVQNTENKIQQAEEKIKRMDEEHEALVEIFSDERTRQIEMEENLRKEWKVRRQINMIYFV